MADPVEDVPWITPVRNAAEVTIDASAVRDATWTKAITAAISELNALFTASNVNVTLKAAKPGLVTVALSSEKYSFPVGGQVQSGVLRTDILHGATRSIDTIIRDKRARERAYIFLPQDPKVDPQKARSRTVGEPVMRVVAAHEFLHALGLDTHDPGMLGLLAKSMSLNAYGKPADDTVSPFGSQTKMPPLTLSGNTVARLQAMWP